MENIRALILVGSSENSLRWWLITAVFYVPWLVMFFKRKTYKRGRELRNQFVYAFACLFLSIVVESIGISSKLWTYFPANWPIMVWVNYFGAGLVGFQLAKTIEESSKK